MECPRPAYKLNPDPDGWPRMIAIPEIKSLDFQGSHWDIEIKLKLFIAFLVLIWIGFTICLFVWPDSAVVAPADNSDGLIAAALLFLL